MPLKDLLQERNSIATKMREMHGEAEKEERGFTSDEDQKWSDMTEALEKLDARIKRAKELPDLDEYKENRQENREEQGKEVTHAQAFSALCRSTQPGSLGLSKDQQEAIKRAQAVGTDAAGGYLVPTEIQNTIINRMVDFGGIRGVANVITTGDGSTLEMPTNDDSGNPAVIIAENTQDTEQDLTLGQVTLGAYKYTTKIIRVPIELLQDSQFDLEAYLAERFASRLGRGTAAHYAAGTGSGQPQGVSLATSGVTAASSTAVTFDELLDLKHSVDPAYRLNGMFVMNDSTFLAVKKLKDGDSRPLWQPDVMAAAPATLDGSPYVIDQGMPSMTTGNEAIAYGDMKGYWIRDVMGMTLTRMVERYADFHQVGFVAIMRTDGKIVDANAIRTLSMA